MAMSQGEDWHKSHMIGAKPPVEALVAVGSNQASGPNTPRETVLAAMARLNDSPLKVVAQSRLYATPAFPAGAGPDYVNAACRVSGAEDPQSLLAILHAVEAEFGRERRQRWGQRILDLDLLAFGDAVLPDIKTQTAWAQLPLESQIARTPEELILPHPRIQDRAFVLVPLSDIAPDWVHPVTGLSVRAMGDALPMAEKTAVTPL